jgi:hypothetical protein
MTAFWDIVPCSLTDADCLHHQANNDGGSIHLWSVSLLQQDYTVLYPTMLASSYSPSWQPEYYDCSECFITLVLTACSYCIIIHCNMSTLILHSAIHFIIALCISWTWMNKALEEWLTELLVGSFLHSLLYSFWVQDITIVFKRRLLKIKGQLMNKYYTMTLMPLLRTELK